MIENEEMSDGDVVGALNAAATRGVDVEVIMTNSKSWAAEFSSLSISGVHVVTYARDASLYIHAKVILADYGASGASVFVGSENFSQASLTENRELGIVTTNAAILSSIHTTLASDFSGGTPTSS
jgi:phosphatidylserine/phosphatidylglycerophosphate/cardiolipin synthase-like enzyme